MTTASDDPLVPCPNPNCLNGHEVAPDRHGEPESLGQCSRLCDHGWVPKSTLSPADERDEPEPF